MDSSQSLFHFVCTDLLDPWGTPQGSSRSWKPNLKKHTWIWGQFFATWTPKYIVFHVISAVVQFQAFNHSKLSTNSDGSGAIISSFLMKFPCLLWNHIGVELTVTSNYVSSFYLWHIYWALHLLSREIGCIHFKYIAFQRQSLGRGLDIPVTSLSPTKNI